MEGPSIHPVPFWNMPWACKAVGSSKPLWVWITKVSFSLTSRTGGLWCRIYQFSPLIFWNTTKQNLRPCIVHTNNSTFKKTIRVGSSISDIPPVFDTCSMSNSCCKQQQSTTQPHDLKDKEGERGKEKKRWIDESGVVCFALLCWSDKRRFPGMGCCAE